MKRNARVEGLPGVLREHKGRAGYMLFSLSIVMAFPLS
jgi:hypothetical protein